MVGMNPDSLAQALFYTTRQNEGDLVVNNLSKVVEHTAKESSGSDLNHLFLVLIGPMQGIKEKPFQN